MLLGAVLIVESDSSRKEGPVIPLLHTLRVYQSVAEGAAQSCESDLQGGGTPAKAAMTDCPSSCSLPPPALGQEGHPMLELAFLISLPLVCHQDVAVDGLSIFIHVNG